MSAGPEYADQGESQSEFEIDFSGFERDNELATGDVEADSSASPTSGDNPKWAPFLEGIPTVLHDTIKAKLREQDRVVNEGFQRKAQEWEPYKRFRDEQIDPDYLHNAYQLAKALEQNPLEIFASLQQRLSQDPGFARAMQERGLLPNYEQEDDGDGFTEASPEEQIAAMQEQMRQRDEQMYAFFQQQQQEQYEQQVFAETEQAIEDDFAQIENQIKQELPLEVKAQIVQTAMVMGQQAGRYVSVIEAAPRVFNLLRSVQTGRRAAPRMIPTSGGNLPRPTSTDPADYTKEDRIAAITAMINQANQG